MATFVDLGDTYPLLFNVTDLSGAPANCASAVLTVTLPDGTTATPALTNSPTGTYYVDYVVTQYGQHTAAFVGTTPAVAVSNTFYAQPWVSILGLEETKQFLKITTTTNDDELRFFLVSATSGIESYTNRKFAQATKSRTFNGYDGWDGTIALSRNAQSVTSVTENGTALTAADYAFDSRTALLYRRTGTYYARWWQPGIQNVVVTYVDGSTTIPADVRHGCLLYVKHLWETQRGGMAPILNTGGDTEWTPGLSDAIPQRVRMLLEPYKIKQFFA